MIERICCTVAAVFLVSAALAQEAVITLRSTVVGNQEQPKVLYIVPWQQPGGPEDLYRPLQSLVSDVFEPVDREEFRRELRYRQMMTESAEVTAP